MEMLESRENDREDRLSGRAYITSGLHLGRSDNEIELDICMLTPSQPRRLYRGDGRSEVLRILGDYLFRQKPRTPHRRSLGRDRRKKKAAVDDLP